MPHNNRTSNTQQTSSRISTVLLRVLFAPVWLFGSLLVSASMWVRPVEELASGQKLQTSSEGTNSAS